MIKQVTVDDLWPGDVVYRRGPPERVVRVSTASDGVSAIVTFASPNGLDEYDELHIWEHSFVRVG